jgi:hypothetical protein
LQNLAGPEVLGRHDDLALLDLFLVQYVSIADFPVGVKVFLDDQ